MAAPDENTLDPKAARQALADSQANTYRTLGVVAEAKRAITIVKAHRERNHYIDSMARIMRGTH